MTEPAAARPRKPRYAATVRRIEKLTPRMLRIVFGGPELAGFNWNGPAAHIKLILGSIGPETEARPLSRTYTPRHFDAARGELTVDFVLHGEGPASTWAAQAQVGQPMLIAGPGRFYAVDEQAQWLLVAGDESAIPAVATILEVVPDHVRTQVLLEVNDAADEFAIAPRRPNVSLRWLHRAQPIVGHGGGARAGIELAAAIAAFELPGGAGRIYVACEADAMRGIRRQLLRERAVSRDWLTTRGYWKQGATDYPDRDYGEDVG
jgi:NADPH-dependent ferric siderophore reductase